MLGRCLPIRLRAHTSRHLQGLPSWHIQRLRQRHVSHRLHALRAWDVPGKHGRVHVFQVPILQLTRCPDWALQVKLYAHLQGQHNQQDRAEAWQHIMRCCMVRGRNIGAGMAQACTIVAASVFCRPSGSLLYPPAQEGGSCTLYYIIDII
jgi:hypothetical protein